MAEDQTIKQENPIISFFCNLFASIKLPFPLPAHQKKGGISNSSDDDSKKIDSVSSSEPQLLLLPAPVSAAKDEYRPVKGEPVDYDALKLATVGDAPEKTTNPFLLWQVYAVGGFFVMRWAWTKWNEKKGPKKPGDEAPPADD